MPVILCDSFVIPAFHISHFKVNDLKIKRNSPPNPTYTSVHCNVLQGSPSFSKNIHLRKRSPCTLRFVPRESINSNGILFDEDTSIIYDWKDQQERDIENMESPWEGAVVYQRNPSISHVEYCTTLERLGLGKLSTEISRSRASVMGLRVTKAVKDFPLGTPVLISIDVTRKKQKLRLDGILRTIITLACNRCGESTPECVFSNFSLLLSEEPIEEPEIINMAMIYGEDKFRTSGSIDEEEDNEASIDLDDRLYFPPDEKAIDISKHIRDMVHVEITLNAVCDPKCKGLCLKCGSNLNTTACDCSMQKTEKRGDGPLRGLRKQMQKN
ncbi:large ribosomal RNA subunit accumulation protein YCED homolog 1, chloroplastic [Diospyros lotus]|uniref:large ribosomal RNA subunit accumulation protein YCED homolog 1, chloroplastic n=1 Tax=Diospyros lotus TaxID=55363 RepID=UPI0022505923|nr:large ribosomal RNA subunit accumulation protein YCED homolog 1, chloroplastic [Diospyros lotus]